jgi:DNA-directed RNA polymerase subunit RPC12/RpoP
MFIKMVCAVCKEEVEVVDLPEIEQDEEGEIETTYIDCPECGKRYYLGG